MIPASLLHASVQVVLAGHPFSAAWPLHVNGQIEVPHLMVQVVALSWHVVVQPPDGQFTLQVPLPAHATVEPAPTVKLPDAFPEIARLLSGPASSEHVLPPPHVETQLPAHEPAQVEPAPHDVVQPVPQLTLQVLLELQFSVTLFATGPLSAPPSPPRVQFPPEHVHVDPVHVHAVVALEQVGVPGEPVSLPLAASLPASVSPPLGGGGGAGEVDVVVTEAWGAELSLPASGFVPSLLSSPHPVAIAEPARLSALNNPTR
jgi:hypothetical protein